METEIYYTATEIDEKGREWYVINGSVGYDLTSGWTKETAEKDYLSEDGTMSRQLAEYEAWGYYD